MPTVEELATYTPPPVLEGWAAGAEANGQYEIATTYRHALDLQSQWGVRARADV